MKTGLLKKYQLLPLIGYLRVPLLQKQNLAMKSSSCKRDGGSQLVRPSAVKRPKFKLSAFEKDIYFLQLHVNVNPQNVSRYFKSHFFR